MLEVIDLSKHYTHRKHLLSPHQEVVKAVDQVSFNVCAGEVLGVVGESGCGKTTTGKCVLNLIRPTSGQILLDGVALNGLTEEQMRPLRRKAQMVFQDAMSCLDPRWTIGRSLAEPIYNFETDLNKQQVAERVDHLLALVGLSTDAKLRFPHEFSGGQRQRIGIAKAMSVNPRFIVCDEPVSALDVSIQAQILNLFLELRARFHLSYLFVSHDLAVVKYISDRVAVMYAGKIVELAAVKEFFEHPLHPYSQILIDAVPHPDPQERYRSVLTPLPEEEGQAAADRCRFYSRCPRRKNQCAASSPELKTMAKNHQVACFYPE